MKIFSKLFRKPKGSINIVPINEEVHTDTQNTVQSSKSDYYIKKLVNIADLNPLTQEEHFQKAIEEIPDNKVAVFFNLQALKVANEKAFIALDEYINSSKENPPEKVFYRGLSHGPAVLYAFTKNCIPDKFDGSRFYGCPTAVLYL